LAVHPSSSYGTNTQHTPQPGTSLLHSTYVSCWAVADLYPQVIAIGVDLNHVGQVDHQGTADAGEESALEAFVKRNHIASLFFSQGHCVENVLWNMRGVMSEADPFDTLQEDGWRFVERSDSVA
jgi:hypothetical protein